MKSSGLFFKIQTAQLRRFSNHNGNTWERSHTHGHKKKQHSGNCDYSTIILSYWNNTMLMKKASTGQERVPLNLTRAKLQMVWSARRTCKTTVWRACSTPCTARLFKNCAARTARLFFLVAPIKFITCDVVVPIGVIDAKAPNGPRVRTLSSLI